MSTRRIHPSHGDADDDDADDAAQYNISGKTLDERIMEQQEQRKLRVSWRDAVDMQTERQASKQKSWGSLIYAVRPPDDSRKSLQRQPAGDLQRLAEVSKLSGQHANRLRASMRELSRKKEMGGIVTVNANTSSSRDLQPGRMTLAAAGLVGMRAIRQLMHVTESAQIVGREREAHVIPNTPVGCLRRMTRTLDVLDSVSCLALCPNDKLIAVGSTKGVLIVTSAHDGKLHGRYTIPEQNGGSIHALCFLSPTRIAAGTFGGVVHIIGIPEAAAEAPLREDSAAATSSVEAMDEAAPDLSSSSAACSTVEGQLDKAAEALQHDTLRCDAVFEVLGKQPVRCLAVATTIPPCAGRRPDERREEALLAVGGSAGFVGVWHVVGGSRFERVGDDDASLLAPSAASFQRSENANTPQATARSKATRTNRWMRTRSQAAVSGASSASEDEDALDDAGAQPRKSVFPFFHKRPRRTLAPMTGAADPSQHGASPAASSTPCRGGPAQTDREASSEEETTAVKATQICRLNPGSPTVSIAMDAAGETIVTANELRMVHIWSVRRTILHLHEQTDVSPPRQLLPEVEFRTTAPIASVSLSADGKRLTVGTVEETEVYKLQCNEGVAHALMQQHRNALINQGFVSRGARGKSFLHGAAAGESAAQQRPPQPARVSTRPFKITEAMGVDAEIASCRVTNKAMECHQNNPRHGMGPASAPTADAGYGCNRHPLCKLVPQACFDRATEVGAAVIARKGNNIAIAGSHHTTVIDVSMGSTVLEVPSDGRVRAVVLSSDGSFVVVGTTYRRLELYNVYAGAELITVPSLDAYAEELSLGATSERSTSFMSDGTVEEDTPRTNHTSTPRPDLSDASLLEAYQINREANHDKDEMAPDELERALKVRQRNQAVVRSTHISKDQSLIAIGSETKSRGLIELYDIASGEMKHAWGRKDGAVWDVCLSPNARLLAAAGYFFKVLLYDTTYGLPITSLPCEPRPDLGFRVAFVWSVTWSEDGHHFAYGSWNGEAKVYRVTETLTRSKPVQLSTAPPRGDGASDNDASPAVPALDTAEASAHRLQVELSEVACITRSNRIYKIVLSEDGQSMLVGGRDKKVALYHLGVSQTEPAWEVRSADSVYAVTATPDMSICAFGGTSKIVHVVNAKGEQLCQVVVDGTIWALDLLLSPRVSKNVRARDRALGGAAGEAVQRFRDEKEDSTEEEMHALLAIGGESMGIRVLELSSRTDVITLPAEDVTYDICLTEDALAFSNGAHVAIYGQGGDSFAWHEQPSFSIASALVQRAGLSQHRAEHVELVHRLIERYPATVNARHPGSGTSLMHFAVEEANNAAMLQLMLDASCRIGLQPNHDERTLLSATLQTGRQQTLRMVLGALVKGHITLMPGTDHLIAEAFVKLAHLFPRELLNFVSRLPLQAEHEVLSDGLYDTVYLQSMLIAGSDSRCPRGMWDDVLEQEAEIQSRQHTPASGEYNFMEMQRGRAMRVLDRTSIINPEKEEEEPVPDLAQMARRGHHSSSGSGSAFVQQLGTSIQQSLIASAYRVDNSFVAMAQQFGHRATPKYERGESKLIQQGFRKHTLCGVTAYRVPFENIASDLQTEHGVLISMLALIVQSAALTREYSVFGSKTMDILLQFKWRGFARKGFFCDAAMGVLQAAFFVASNYDMSQWSDLHRPLPWSAGVSESEAAFDHSFVIHLLFVGATTLWSLFDVWRERQQCVRGGSVAYLVSPFNYFDMIRILCQLGINALFFFRDSPTIGWSTRVDPGCFAGVSSCATRDALYGLQALLFVVLCLNLLYFARAILGFAVLVHVLWRVVYDIMPFLLVLFVLWLGFAFALSLLFRNAVLTSPQLVQDDFALMFPEQASWSFGNWVYLVLNMGLYGHLDDGTLLLLHESVITEIIFFAYMIVVNLVLLNLLIAIMQFSYERSTAEAHLVAKYRRAELILEQQRANTTLNKTRQPRWLHVLMPASADEELLEGSPSAELDSIREQLDKLKARLNNEF